MIKNDIPEGSRLPEQATVLTSIYKYTSEFINPSIYIDITGNVFQRLPAINFDLKPGELGLSWGDIFMVYWLGVGF